jgi:hypothetical protein
MVNALYAPRCLLASIIALAALAIAPAHAAAKPSFAKSVTVVRLSGTVRVSIPGHGASGVRSSRTVPVGSVLDVSRGWARVIAAMPSNAGTRRADVNGGKVRLVQKRTDGGLTELRLTERLEGCTDAYTARKHDHRKVKTRTGAGGRGARARAATESTFRTVARYQTAENVGAATWDTRDTCSATYLAATAGQVTATTRGTVTVTRDLELDEVDVTRCVDAGPPPVSKGYCVTVAGWETDGDFIAEIYAETAAETYQLCVTSPTGRRTCGTWPFSAPEQTSGERGNMVMCDTNRLGDYSFAWRVGGVSLGPSMPMYRARERAIEPWSCTSDFGASSFTEDTYSLPLASNTKFVNRYLLPTAGRLWDFDFGLDALKPTGIPGTAWIQGVVYADANGSPGQLVAKTTQVMLKSTEDWFWKLLESGPRFDPEVPIPAGDYWIGLITGGDSFVAKLDYDNPATLASNADPFGDGPTALFGPFDPGLARLTVQVGYFGSMTLVE